MYGENLQQKAIYMFLLTELCRYQPPTRRFWWVSVDSQHTRAGSDSRSAWHSTIRPRSHLSVCRIHVTPAKRGRGRKALSQPTWDEKTTSERHAAMTWMQRLKRVFSIDIETCEKCKGPVKIIACVEDPIVIEKILKYFKEKAVTNNSTPPPGRAPPQFGLFDFS